MDGEWSPVYAITSKMKEISGFLKVFRILIKIKFAISLKNCMYDRITYHAKMVSSIPVVCVIAVSVKHPHRLYFFDFCVMPGQGVDG